MLQGGDSAHPLEKSLIYHQHKSRICAQSRAKANARCHGTLYLAGPPLPALYMLHCRNVPWLEEKMETMPRGITGLLQPSATAPTQPIQAAGRKELSLVQGKMLSHLLHPRAPELPPKACQCPAIPGAAGLQGDTAFSRTPVVIPARPWAKSSTTYPITGQYNCWFFRGMT